MLNLIVNILVVGGDEFVYNLNSFLVSPLAIITSLMATLLWRQMKSGMQSRLLWAGLFIGWICWAVAETLWAGYSLTGQDPYPSWADFFFLIAYIPLSIGLISRIIGLPKRPEKSQQLMIWAVSLIVVTVATFFILIPIVQEYDPELWFEGLLSLFYPLADLILLLLVLNLLFTYGPGDYGLGWRLILVGFVTVIVSDLFFAYADWNGLYYPDSKANLFSTVGVDALYNASYGLWTLGTYALHILLREHRPFQMNFQPRLTTNAHVFLYTNRNETITEVSHNYQRLFPLKNPNGRPLAEALGISNHEQNNIHAKIIVNKKLTDYKILLKDPSGELHDGWLCGLPMSDPSGEYFGAILVLRTFLVGDPDEELSEYQKSMVPYVLEHSNSDENNSIRMLFLDYYLAYIKSLFNLAIREGGAAMSQTLLDELQVQAQQNGWRLRFNPQTILDGDSESPATLGAALAALVEGAKQFTSRLTDAITVEAELQKVHSQFSESAHQTVSRLRQTTRNGV
ncbi:MAG TPA: hypothetical protein VFR47_26560 [Anaerolineales bacterium]|nr:hypothetical protein [Anaerolineales bacterium]